MAQYGLIGRTLKHSFSQQYFREKFITEEIGDSDYSLFELERIEDFPRLLKRNPGLQGLNVTIPYKTSIIPYLDELDKTAEAVGAVNTIRFKNDRLRGYNTDVFGFRTSLLRLVNQTREERNMEETAPGLHLPTAPVLFSFGNAAQEHSIIGSMNALILGTGGASKAVAYALESEGANCRTVSRTPGRGSLTYEGLNADLIETYELIVNTTPLGTHPDPSFPDIPYEGINRSHYLFDLVYNPPLTPFLRKGKERGAAVRNGLEMLHLQADRSYDIWTGISS